MNGHDKKNENSYSDRTRSRTENSFKLSDTERYVNNNVGNKDTKARFIQSRCVIIRFLLSVQILVGIQKAPLFILIGLRLLKMNVIRIKCLHMMKVIGRQLYRMMPTKGMPIEHLKFREILMPIENWNRHRTA